MKKLRIGVIGTGYLGKFHAEKYASMTDVDLVGVVDVQEEQAKRIADKCKTNYFTNYQELLGKVDAASIVVPTQFHHEVSKAFLEHGTHLLIEKPMTTTIDEADELIDLANKKGVLIQVGHLERFNPAVIALKDVIHSPKFVESHRISTYKGRGIDVSVVLDLMIHDIDLIKNFVQSEVKTIHAAGVPVICSDVDIANARIEFECGCIANVTASRISMKDERKIRIFQKDTYVSVDFAKKEIIHIVKTDSKEPNDIIPGMKINTLTLPAGDALFEELSAFVHAIIHHTPPIVTGKDGRDALKIALDIMQQMQARLSSWVL